MRVTNAYILSMGRIHSDRKPLKGVTPHEKKFDTGYSSKCNTGTQHLKDSSSQAYPILQLEAASTGLSLFISLSLSHTHTFLFSPLLYSPFIFLELPPPYERKFLRKCESHGQLQSHVLSTLLDASPPLKEGRQENTGVVQKNGIARER
jgi:hypothetical protein